ncbi:MAG: DUF4834 domain-containing protein [Sphingobacteriales bacterium]|nr:MAG: DUF4834 domain-containing protein [Sphingobacteriales bacterium]
MGLIRFLIFTLCIFYVVKTLAKIFLPFLFKKAVSKMQNNMNGQNATQASTKPEGTISVDYIPPTTKKQPKFKGNDDFIPYEEVK